MGNERTVYRTEGTAALKAEQHPRPKASIISFEPKHMQNSVSHFDSAKRQIRMADRARVNESSVVAPRNAAAHRKYSDTTRNIYIRGFIATSAFALVMILIGA
ncbi:MAG: hypothetical protein U0M72_01605 [Eggerthellaceae bacterium]